VKCHISYRWVVGLALGFAWGMTMAVFASAEPDHFAADGRFALEINECPRALGESVRRFIGIEVGDLLYGEAEGVPASTDRLTIRCAGNFAWVEATGATETSPLEKLLRLDDFPGDAAPRALALASLELMAARSSTVRERIDGNHTSPPPAATPPPTTPPVTTPKKAARAPSPKSAAYSQEARIGLAGSWRTFLVEHGPSMWGGQAQASTRVRRIWQLAADVDVVGARDQVQNLGKAGALLLSSGATFGVRTGDNNFGTSLGLGGRIGVVRLSGSSADPANISGATVWRPWGGPMAAASVFSGFGRFVLTLIAEAGQSLLEPEGQAGGVTVISLRGPWAAMYLGASVRP
jgi:hypothetical protein